MTLLVGSYRCLSAIVDGKPLPAGVIDQLKLTLTEDRYKTERGEQVLFESTYSLDTSALPWKMDILGTEGPNAGKAGLGICSLEGEIFTLCHTMPGGERPGEFESPAGSGAYLIVWERK